jgi:hypothetical protein
MRSIVTLFAFGAVGLLLSGCQFGGPTGVFQHTNVPPPPSMTGDVKASAAQSVPVSPARRRQAAESEQGSPSAPEPAVQPVMTGSGMGAGFRF